MLSPALTQLFERARTRFGVDIEILDSSLNSSYPEVETDLQRAIRDSPAIRQALLGCLTTGRVGQVVISGQRCDVVPLRRGASAQRGVALGVLRLTAGPSPTSSEFWVEFVRATVEADGETLAALSDERQRSRRLLGTMRFLGQLVGTESEAALQHALIQAAAIWFDADARVYRRDLGRQFVLDTALPGAVIADEARQLLPPAGAALGGVHRTSTSALWADGNDAEAILVPLSANEPTSSVLVLINAKVDDPSSLPILGQVAGVQIELARASRRDRVRQRFLDLVHDRDAEVGAMPERMVRELAVMTGAGSAALTLESHDCARRLVSFGNIPEVETRSTRTRERDDPWKFEPAGFTCELPLRGGVKAIVELRPGPDAVFSTDAALSAKVGIEILSIWLTAQAPALLEASMTTGKAAPPAAFRRRMEEELERAKRFDLRLGLVIVDLPPLLTPEERLHLENALRKALRGSDVLGLAGAHRIAALLTHTDGSGSARVVERLRRGLAQSAARLRVDGVSVGHAEFSPACRTVDALVAAAARDAVPVGSA